MKVWLDFHTRTVQDKRRGVALLKTGERLSFDLLWAIFIDFLSWISRKISFVKYFDQILYKFCNAMIFLENIILYLFLTRNQTRYVGRESKLK